MKSIYKIPDGDKINGSFVNSVGVFDDLAFRIALRLDGFLEIFQARFLHQQCILLQREYDSKMVQ